MLAKFYDIIGSATTFLKDDEVKALADTCDDMGILLQGLRNFAARHELVWQIRPKCHKAMHLPFFCVGPKPSLLELLCSRVSSGDISASLAILGEGEVASSCTDSGSRKAMAGIAATT